MTTDIVAFRQPVGVSEHVLEVSYRYAKGLAASGFFKDSRDASQAFAKIVAGHELGIGPAAAMQQIHVVDGKLAPGATLVNALVRRSGVYRFRPVEATDTVCRLEWFERVDGDWVSQGFSQFTLEDAKRAGLAGKQNWRSYPGDMLFARALTQGARRFAADVFGGQAVYTPDELGAVTDRDGDVIIDDTSPVETVPDAAVEAAAMQLPVDVPTITEKDRRRLFAVANECGIGEAEQKALVYQVAGVTSRALIPVDRFDAVVAAYESRGRELKAGVAE